ncbi:MAG: hypothetical protein CMJ58_02260 [Planctomycetaceae bacterium]|nr:hypothetical protein [Planctomycetaceae bacterium]
MSKRKRSSQRGREDRPASHIASPAGLDDSGTPTDDSDAPSDGYWRRAKSVALAVVAVGGVVLLTLTLVTGGAAVYTSRSEFCDSCHIMEPYYKSWQESSHKDVACIKCHFPPGAGEKVRGKMLGLVQLIKYVTATASTRLSAEVSDASCLRCHDTRLLAGRVDFDGIPFDHRPHLTDSRRGKQLRCTSCHSQIVQGTHMTVTKSTCFLCHFKDQRFNEGLGTCTRCHQIPDKQFDLGGGVEFSHDLVYERGVDCQSCHGDLNRGNGEVPRERCIACHNREDDLKQIDDHEFMHQMHVTDHKVDCLQCHLEIEHSLHQDRIEHAAGDCQSCHGNQHAEQVQLMLGKPDEGAATAHGGMAAAGLSCPSCHQVAEESPAGNLVWKASTNICSQCHGEAEVERYLADHELLKSTLTELSDNLLRAQEALQNSSLDANRKSELGERLETMESDLQFLRIGDGIHNMHYADTLLQKLVDGLRVICRELQIEEPAVKLPAEIGLKQ